MDRKKRKDQYPIYKEGGNQFYEIPATLYETMQKTNAGEFDDYKTPIDIKGSMIHRIPVDKFDAWSKNIEDPGIMQTREKIEDAGTSDVVINKQPEGRDTRTLPEWVQSPSGQADFFEKYKDNPLAQRMLNRNHPRITNPDGSFSTLRMGLAEVDGRHIVYPSIFETEGKWAELEGDNAITKAFETGQFFEFDDPVTARWIAQYYRQMRPVQEAHGIARHGVRESGQNVIETPMGPLDVSDAAVKMSADRQEKFIGEDADPARSDVVNLSDAEKKGEGESEGGDTENTTDPKDPSSEDPMAKYREIFEKDKELAEKFKRLSITKTAIDTAINTGALIRNMLGETPDTINPSLIPHRDIPSQQVQQRDSLRRNVAGGYAATRRMALEMGKPEIMASGVANALDAMAQGENAIAATELQRQAAKAQVDTQVDAANVQAENQTKAYNQQILERAADKVSEANIQALSNYSQIAKDWIETNVDMQNRENAANVALMLIKAGVDEEAFLSAMKTWKSAYSLGGSNPVVEKETKNIG